MNWIHVVSWSFLHVWSLRTISPLFVFAIIHLGSNTANPNEHGFCLHRNGFYCHDMGRWSLLQDIYLACPRFASQGFDAFATLVLQLTERLRFLQELLAQAFWYDPAKVHILLFGSTWLVRLWPRTSPFLVPMIHFHDTKLYIMPGRGAWNPFHGSFHLSKSYLATCSVLYKSDISRLWRAKVCSLEPYTLEEGW